MSQKAPQRTAFVVGSACVAAVGTSALIWWWRRRSSGGRAPSKRRLGAVCSDEELVAAIPGVRARYDLSESGGFLPERVPPRLPAEFDAWEALIADLPALNRSGKLRAAVDVMPELDAATLLADVPTERLRRAHLVLGMLSHSYVHGPIVPWHLLEQNGRKVNGVTNTNGHGDAANRALPRQLARPWFDVCRKLQMPPVLTSPALDMWNWELIDPSGGFKVPNLRLTSSMTGTSTEKQFHMVPCAMQSAAAKVVPKLFMADVLVRGQRCDALIDLLGELSDVLAGMRTIFGHVTSGVDKDVFYDVYRPLLDGFFPEGVVFQHVDPKDVAAAGSLAGLFEASRYGEVTGKAKGPSAGQSTMILLFDLFLGVSHNPAGTEFQEEMLRYMPEPHRRMVRDYHEKWRSAKSVRRFVETRRSGHGQAGANLAAAYDECVCALRDLRRYHLATVTRYLARTNTGTGASSWRIFLQGAVDSTEEARLAAKCPFS